VKLVLFAHFDCEREMDVGEPGSLGFSGALLGGALPGDTLRLVRDLFLVRLRGWVGEPLREEIVAGVAVPHLDDVACGSEVLHVFPQDDLHHVLSVTVQAGVLRRRRNSSQVSVTPRAAGPGTGNTTGRTTTPPTPPPITTAPAAMPTAADQPTTSAPRRPGYGR